MLNQCKIYTLDLNHEFSLQLYKFLFDLILYVQSTIIQLNRDGSSCDEPVLKPHSHCADVATVHPDAGQPVYRDAPGHIL